MNQNVLLVSRMRLLIYLNRYMLATLKIGKKTICYDHKSTENLYLISLVGPKAPYKQGPCQIYPLSLPTLPWHLAQRTVLKRWWINICTMIANKNLLAPMVLRWLYFWFLMLNEKLGIAPRSGLRFFPPFFREEKEMNQRYEYRLLNHMLMNHFPAVIIIMILVSEAHLSF